MRTAIYHQTNETGQFDELATLRAQAKLLDSTVIAEYREATLTDRTAWDRCRKKLERARHDCLLISSLLVLGPGLAAVVRTLAALRTCGIRLVSLRENLDTATANGQAAVDVIVQLVEEDRERHGHRTRIGMTAARQRGRRIGQRRNKFDKAKATLLRDQGWGIIKIARELHVGVGTVQRWVKTEYKATINSFRDPPKVPMRPNVAT